MKRRLPLYSKIVLWFFLNILVLTVIGWFVVRAQVRSGFDSFMSGYVGQRVEPVAAKVIAKLAQSELAEWDKTLTELSHEYNVHFAVMLEGGRLYSSSETQFELPDELRRRLPKGPPRRPPGRRSGPPNNDENNGGMQSGPGPGFERQNDDLPGGGPLPPGMAGGPAPIHQRFMIRTSAPEFYWVGMQSRFSSADNNNGTPGTLLIRSSTFTAGGLFFDYTPWILTVAGIALFSALFWLPLVRSMTHSVSQLTHAAEAIAEGKFDVQLDTKRSDELGQLGDSVNQMAARLAGYVHGQKRFLGDTAHELCAPIARMQMALGILEQRADEKQQAYVEDVREELQHMSGLVNELLSFSKAGLRPEALKLNAVSVEELVQKVMAREAKDNATVTAKIPPGLVVLGEKELLGRALGNVVRNAIRYAGNGGPIEIVARTLDKEAEIIVSDHGPGVPEADISKLFDPFFRVDVSRARETGGVGLGLTIVKTCVEACCGTVSVRNRKRGGLRLIIRLKLPDSIDSLTEC